MGFQPSPLLHVFVTNWISLYDNKVYYYSSYNAEIWANMKSNLGLKTQAF
jgi:hypothetical protein